MPRATSAARYISLYRRVKRDGVVALKHQPDDSQGSDSSFEDNASDTIRQQNAQKQSQFVACHKNEHQQTDPLQRIEEEQPDVYQNLSNSINGAYAGTNKTTLSDITSYPDIENRVEEVIDDLLKSRLHLQTQSYSTLYAEDIRQDLRSLIPRVSQSQGPINNSSNANQSRGNRAKCSDDGPSQPHSPNEVSNIIYRCDRSKMFSNAGSQTEHVSQYQPHLNNSQPRKVLKTKSKLDSIIQNDFHRSTNRGQSTPEHFHPSNPRESFSSAASFHNFQKWQSRSLHRSENFCPQYDRFASHSNRRKISHNATNVFVNPPSKGIGMAYDKWINTEDNDQYSSFDIPFALPSKVVKKGAESIKLRNHKNEDLLANKQYTYENREMHTKTERRHILSTVPVNCEIKIENNHAGNVGLKSNSSNSNFTDGSAIFSVNIDKKLSSFNPVFIDNTDAIVDLENKSPSEIQYTTGDISGVPQAKKPLTREPTWRYGQEPCPLNYERKLMGKIDISKEHEWKTRGLPSTLSMPGYIYDDGVLTETRC